MLPGPPFSRGPQPGMTSGPQDRLIGMTAHTFVLVPGAGVRPRVWRWTIEALCAAGHDAVAPDLPLDDASAAPSDHSSAIVAALDGRDGSFVLVGTSLGAYSATLAA